MRLTGEELAQACKGSWVGGEIPQWISGVSTDSREFVAGHVFLALRGIHFDGHGHAAAVADQALALIGDAQGVAQWAALSHKPQLVVQDTLQALGDIAAYHRRKLEQTTVIAITGSYGKTTVRSMLAHVLEHLGLQVAATKENFNNLIGVPKTVLGIEPEADVAVIECGISEQGEMERLSAIVQPDIAIVTGLTHAHGQGLGDLHGVAQEKAKLMTHMANGGWCLLGQGVSEQFARAKCTVLQPAYAVEEDGVSWSLAGQQLTLGFNAETSGLRLSLPARHWAEDMALVATLVLKFGQQKGGGWSLAQVAQALQTWQPVDGRMRVYPVSEDQDFTLIDDSYNANPASMQAALDTLAELEGYKIAVIGDMLELGDIATECHARLDLHDIDEVIVVGPLMHALQQAQPHRKIRSFEHSDACLSWFEAQAACPRPNCTILLKSSHGVALYKVADYLRNRGHHVI